MIQHLLNAILDQNAHQKNLNENHNDLSKPYSLTLQ
jgi:hypothetical protein